ncbi:MAG: adenylate cyclase [Gaiellaceae bacterium]
MASATVPRTALPDEELLELVTLIKDVDTVELKLTVPEPAQLTTARALGLDPLQAEIRQVFFFDTPDLTLDEHGVVVRARRSQKKGDDTVVKLRPVVPSELPRELRQSPDFGVELDASPKGYVCSGSLKGAPSEGTVLKAMSGKKAVRKLFTKEQQALYAEHAPDNLDLDTLSMLGPLLVLKLKTAPEGFDRKLVTEMWLYPDGSRILELSTKCAPTEAFQVAAETRAFLASRGIDLSGKQQTKTRSALEFFAKGLQNGKASRPQSPAKDSAASTTTKSRA